MYVSLMDFLLAPRIDHRGWNTPNEASRILLLSVIAVVSYWAWPLSEGMIYMWLTIIVLVLRILRLKMKLDMKMSPVYANNFKLKRI